MCTSVDVLSDVGAAYKSSSLYITILVGLSFTLSSEDSQGYPDFGFTV
jgi:hypothetical protein